MITQVTHQNCNQTSTDNQADHQTYLDLIEKEMKSALTDSEGPIREMSHHIFNAGGKRIRPLLVIYSGLVFNPSLSPMLLQAAIATELVHMASLVHDDIIDESGMRRNKPSVNHIWGNQAAVLCGDYLFAKAFDILAGNQLISNLKLMVQAIQAMCHGEIKQAEERYHPEVSLEQYYNRITKKTAILLQFSCLSGAMVGGAEKKQQQYLGDYGLNLGFAFQIIDDILDFCGDWNLMGKPKHEDLKQGNITLPMILLLDHPQYRDWAYKLIHDRDFSKPNLAQVEKVLVETGIIAKSFEIANTHIKKAKNILGDLPEAPAKYYLIEMAEKLKARTY